MLEERAGAINISEALMKELVGVVPKNAGRDIATPANGDHEVGVEFIENFLCGLLAELVDLASTAS